MASSRTWRETVSRIRPWREQVSPTTNPGFHVDNSSMTVGRVRAKSPVRTPARKSVVGSPRPKVTTPTVVVIPPPMVATTGVEETKDVGTTYADQMARTKSTIYSDFAPSKPPGVASPTKSPTKVAMPHAQSSDGTRFVPSHVVAYDRTWSLTKPRTAAQSLDGSRYVLHFFFTDE